MAPGIQKTFHNKFNKSVDSSFPAGPSSKSVHRVACDLTCDQVKREEGPPDRRFPSQEDNGDVPLDGVAFSRLE